MRMFMSGPAFNQQYVAPTALGSRVTLGPFHSSSITSCLRFFLNSFFHDVLQVRQVGTRLPPPPPLAGRGRGHSSPSLPRSTRGWNVSARAAEQGEPHKTGNIISMPNVFSTTSEGRMCRTQVDQPLRP